METYIFQQIRAEANKCTVQKHQRNGSSIVCCIGCFNPSLSHQIVNLFHECGHGQCLGIITVNVSVRVEFGSRSNHHRDKTFLEPSFNDPTTSRFAFESMTSVRPPHQHVWFMAPCVPSFPLVCRVLHLVHGSICREIDVFVVFPFPPNHAVRCGCARGPSIIHHTDCNVQIISSNLCLSGSDMAAIPDTCLAMVSLSTMISNDLGPRGQIASSGKWAEIVLEMQPLLPHSFGGNGLSSTLCFFAANEDVWIGVVSVASLNLNHRGS